MDTVDNKKVVIGEDIETMTKLEGWKHVDEWVNVREKEYIGNLKQADNFKEVIKNQSYLEMIDKLRAYIRNSINDKNKELNNQVKDR
jgi:hypothetical protein